MPRLYFKYGTMGSSKSAQALMCKFNYEQKGMKVLLVKPSLDTRGDDGQRMVRSRIGLSAACEVIKPDESFLDLYKTVKETTGCDCIIVDEAQFCTAEQVNELKYLTRQVPVLCYGLMNDFRCQLFEGCKRIYRRRRKLRKYVLLVLEGRTGKG